jgi:Domain of unknown function (DUF1992)
LTVDSDACLPDRMRGPQRSGLQMRLLDALVEQRIAAAAARGEFDDLPGVGVTLTLEDDVQVPEEVRVANRILKNAGFVPPAVEQLRALRDLQDELDAVGERASRCRLQARLLALDMALESLRGGPLVLPHEYCRRIAERLSERAAGNVGGGGFGGEFAAPAVALAVGPAGAPAGEPGPQ